MAKIINFGRECVGELRKVVWPTRENVLSSVKIVLISTVIIAIFLGMLDAFFVLCLSWIF